MFRQLAFSIIGRYTCGAARVLRGPRCQQANTEQRVCIRTRKPKRHCCRGFLWPRSESISLECQDCMNGILSLLVLPFRIHVQYISSTCGLHVLRKRVHARTCCVHRLIL